MSKPQSLSTQMAAGNTRNVQRIRALLKDHAPKVNHHFCPPLDVDHDKTRRISKAVI